MSAKPLSRVARIPQTTSSKSKQLAQGVVNRSIQVDSIQTAMRRRITYIHSAESSFSLDQQAGLSKDALTIRNLNAAKEERITFGFDELSIELWQVFKDCHELHIRWSTERAYDAVAPFSSRVSPGLHVFYTPVAAAHRATDRLCPLLKKVFSEDLKCLGPEISFTAPPILSERFASISSLQFYSLVPSLTDLVTYIQQVICSSDHTDCQNHASSLLTADSVDFDYDSISHSLTISGYWSQPPQGRRGWTEDITRHKGTSEKIEIGILANEHSRDPEELSMGGFLAVVGEDNKLNPTLFSFPSRHHPFAHDATYTTSFESPTGLHPTLKISISQPGLTRPPAPSDATCSLHAYLTLPSTIFADKYQLSTDDPLFLKSHHLVALRSVSGETDLEAPDWVILRWGSNLLLELATPDNAQGAASSGFDWDITIPLHLRYLEPSESGYRPTSMPWPVVFWACTAEDGTKMGVNPFDRANLGWEGLFGPRTMFFQLHPAVNGSRPRVVEDIKVPVLQAPRTDDRYSQIAQQIELGTVVVIVLGFVWVLWKLGLVVRSSGVGDGKQRQPTASSAQQSDKDK